MSITAATRALRRLELLTSDKYPTLYSYVLRDLLIDNDLTGLDEESIESDPDWAAAYRRAPLIRHLLDDIRADPYHQQAVTMLYLEQSLCPMHHGDYASCFDDDNPECAVIREYFPNHDT